MAKAWTCPILDDGCSSLHDDDVKQTLKEYKIVVRGLMSFSGGDGENKDKVIWCNLCINSRKLIKQVSKFFSEELEFVEPTELKKGYDFYVFELDYEAETIAKILLSNGYEIEWLEV